MLTIITLIRIGFTDSIVLSFFINQKNTVVREDSGFFYV